MRNTLGEKEVASKLKKDDKKALEAAVEDALKWLESSQEASKEEYVDRKKELEAVSNPIMTKLYGAAGAPFAAEEAAAGSGPAGASEQGPTIEEVD